MTEEARRAARGRAPRERQGEPAGAAPRLRLRGIGEDIGEDGSGTWPHRGFLQSSPCPLLSQRACECGRPSYPNRVG